MSEEGIPVIYDSAVPRDAVYLVSFEPQEDEDDLDYWDDFEDDDEDWADE